jgi:thioredoxin 1
LSIRLAEYDWEALGALIDGGEEILVHFGTDWCAPCKRLERVLVGLLEEERLHLKVAKINVEDFPDLASRYSVTKNPTLCYFRQGRLEKSSQGFMTGEEVLDFSNGLERFSSGLGLVGGDAD